MILPSRLRRELSKGASINAAGLQRRATVAHQMKGPMKKSIAGSTPAAVVLRWQFGAGHEAGFSGVALCAGRSDARTSFPDLTIAVSLIQMREPASGSFSR